MLWYVLEMKWLANASRVQTYGTVAFRATLSVFGVRLEGVLDRTGFPTQLAVTHHFNLAVRISVHLDSSRVIVPLLSLP